SGFIHLGLAVRVERVEDRPRRFTLLLIVRLVDEAYPLQERLDPNRLWRDCLIGGVGAANDLRHVDHRRIFFETVLPDECVEAALRAAMAELYVLHVVWRRVSRSRLSHHLVGRHVDELGVLVDEFLDEPRARDAIHARTFTG